MTDERKDARGVADSRDFETLSDLEREGFATRMRVKTTGGDKGILYAWDSDAVANRVAWCHSPDHGAQLFVVPEVLERGPNWCLMHDLGGVQMDRVVREDPDWLESPHGQETVVSIGRTLRKLHSGNPMSHFGDLVEDNPERWMTFNGYVAAHLEDFAERVRLVGLKEKTTSEMMQIIGHIRHELASFHPRSPSSLVHGRLAFENIWLNSEHREVVALTGFESAVALPAEIDLAWLMWIGGIAESDILTRSLYRGYGAARTMDVQRRERFFKRLVALLALFGTVSSAGRDVESLAKLAGAQG